MYINLFLSLEKFSNFIWWNSSLFDKKTCISFIFSDLIFSKKGFRHLLSLPVNGQRTWSNKKTPKKLNSFLINFKINQFKSLLDNSVNLKNLKALIFLNYFNWLWKIFEKKIEFFYIKRIKK